jgi:hypothetical protein
VSYFDLAAPAINTLAVTFFPHNVDQAVLMPLGPGTAAFAGVCCHFSPAWNLVGIAGLGERSDDLCRHLFPEDNPSLVRARVEAKNEFPCPGPQGSRQAVSLNFDRRPKFRSG